MDGFTGAAERNRASGRLRRHALGVALGLGALLAALIGAAPAIAGLRQEFSVFDHCPVSAPGVVACTYSTVNGGEFKIGSQTVPIEKTVTLQGGLTSTSLELVPAVGAETLSRTPLTVPGGLLGIELLGNLTEVTATAEQAGPIDVSVSAFGKREGPAVTLPLQVKLDNPLLGSSCYVGTPSEPLTPHLTTGTTSPPSGVAPLTGSSGELSFHGAGKINIFSNASLVDNTFPAPGASGCAGVLSLVVDPSVDLKTGLPAEAGTSKAVMDSTLEQASVTNVIRQRELPEIGRCVKVASEKVAKIAVYHGLYVNSGCTYESPQRSGEYEWQAGVGAGKTFTTAGKAVMLETVAHTKVKCLESTGSGEYTGTKTATLGLTLTGCTLLSSKESCQSSGEAAGEITAPSLQATLGFISDAIVEGALKVSLGWDLAHEPSIVSATCGASAEPLQITGSVIAPISTIDKVVSAYSLLAKATAGKQAPEAFEEEGKDTLSEALGAGSPEQVGLTSSVKVTDSEKLEFKAVSE